MPIREGDMTFDEWRHEVACFIDYGDESDEVYAEMEALLDGEKSEWPGYWG